MFYLYVKTHNKTGLKYLGKTSQDPQKYPGSGKRWKNHLKVHGRDITTEVLRECKTKTEIEEWGVYYSEKWNVVNSAEFANLIPEKGDGGATLFNAEANKKNAVLGGYAKAAKKYPPGNKGKKMGPRSKESIEKQRKTITGRKRGPYKWKNGYGPWNKGKKLNGE